MVGGVGGGVDEGRKGGWLPSQAVVQPAGIATLTRGTIKLGHKGGAFNVHLINMSQGGDSQLSSDYITIPQLNQLTTKLGVNRNSWHHALKQMYKGSNYMKLYDVPDFLLSTLYKVCGWGGRGGKTLVPWCLVGALPCHLTTCTCLLLQDKVLSKYNSTTKEMVHISHIAKVLSWCKVPEAVTSSIMAQLKAGVCPLVVQPSPQAATSDSGSESESEEDGSESESESEPKSKSGSEGVDYQHIHFPSTLPEPSPEELALPAKGKYGLNRIPKQQRATLWNKIKPHYHSYFK
jgi:hypothetical protein